MADYQFRIAVASLAVLAGLLVSPSGASAAPPVCNGRTATIVGSGTINGTGGDDVIVGSDSADQIWGRGGNDIICAMGGDDRVEGGPGNDWLHGGAGSDTAYGQDGADVLIGATGADTLDGGPGADRLLGRQDNDTLAGGSGNDEIFGEEGNDHLYGGGGNDKLAGGPGQDNVVGNSGDDTIAGGADSDHLAGGDGDDSLRGGGGNDVLQGGWGTDQIWGDAGNDDLHGDTNDTLNGGSGTDSCEPIVGATLIACETGGNAPPPPPPPPEPEPEPEPEPDPDPQPNEVADWYRSGMPVPVATEQTLWVSPSGNDANPGTESQPLRSIQLAVDRANPGTTIYLMDGRWEGQGRSGLGWITIGVEDSGQPGRWVRLTAAPGASPHLTISQGEGIRIEGAYIEISGLKIEGIHGGPGDPNAATGPHYGYGILIKHIDRFGAPTPAHHVVISDNEVSGFSVGGIATDEANWLVVGGNEVHGNSNWGPEGGSGISLLEHSNAGGGGQGVTTSWITNNLVHNNRQLVNSTKIGFDHITDGNCIILDRMDLGSGIGQRTLISENTVHSCGGRGVNIYKSSDVEITRNLTWHNGITPRLSGEMYGNGNNITFSYNTMVPRPGRDDLIGAGTDVNNVVLDPSTPIANAVDQHRARTGAQIP